MTETETETRLAARRLARATDETAAALAAHLPAIDRAAAAAARRYRLAGDGPDLAQDTWARLLASDAPVTPASIGRAAAAAAARSYRRQQREVPADLLALERAADTAADTVTAAAAGTADETDETAATAAAATATADTGDALALASARQRRSILGRPARMAKGVGRSDGLAIADWSRLAMRDPFDVLAHRDSERATGNAMLTAWRPAEDTAAAAAWTRLALDLPTFTAALWAGYEPLRLATLRTVTSFPGDVLRWRRIVWTVAFPDALPSERAALRRAARDWAATVRAADRCEVRAAALDTAILRADRADTAARRLARATATAHRATAALLAGPPAWHGIGTAGTAALYRRLTAAGTADTAARAALSAPVRYRPPCACHACQAAATARQRAALVTLDRATAAAAARPALARLAAALTAADWSALLTLDGPPETPWPAARDAARRTAVTAAWHRSRPAARAARLAALDAWAAGRVWATAADQAARPHGWTADGRPCVLDLRRTHGRLTVRALLALVGGPARLVRQARAARPAALARKRRPAALATAATGTARPGRAAAAAARLAARLAVTAD